MLGVAGPDGFATETLRYVVHARPKPKFHTILDARRLFAGGGIATVTMRAHGNPEPGHLALELDVDLRIGELSLRDQFEASWTPSGLVSRKLLRTAGTARLEEVDFERSPFPFPPATYPDVLLPFLLRAQPRDGARRAVYAWTSDRFCSRVYYESRGHETIEVPAGSIKTTSVWIYPDLNDWVSLGSLLSRLAKPLLPRYELWIEEAAPHRIVRFEGAFGPPGAPEIILELAK